MGVYAPPPRGKQVRLHHENVVRCKTAVQFRLAPLENPTVRGAHFVILKLKPRVNAAFLLRGEPMSDTFRYLQDMLVLAADQYQHEIRDGIITFYKRIHDQPNPAIVRSDLTRPENETFGTFRDYLLWRDRGNNHRNKT